MVKKENEQSFFKGSVILFVSMIIVKAIGALFKIPLTNMLGATGMSYFSSAYNIYVLVYALSVTGLSTALARKIAEQKAQGRYADIKQTFRLSILLFLLIGILGFILTFLLGGAFSSLIGSSNTSLSIIMIAPSVFFCSLMAAYRGYYEGLNDMRPTAVVQVIEVVSKLLLGLLLSYAAIAVCTRQYKLSGMIFGKAIENNDLAIAITPYSAAAAMLGVSLSTAVGLLYLIIKHRTSQNHITNKMLLSSPKPLARRKILCSLLKLSWPITAAAVMVQLSAVIDTVTIQNSLLIADKGGILTKQYGVYLKGGEIVSEFLFGIFSSCITLFNVIPAFCGVISKSGLPTVAGVFTKSKRDELKSSIENIIKMSVVIAAPLGIGMGVMAQSVLTIAYKSQPCIIEIGTPLLQIMAAGSIFLAISGVITAILQGIGKTQLPLYCFVAGAAVKVILNIVLVNNTAINIYGAAISTTVCYAVVFFLSMFFLIKNVNISLDYKEIFIKPLLCGAFCGLSAFLCFFILTKLYNNSIIILVSIAFGGLCYVCSLFMAHIISISKILDYFKHRKQKNY